ncbi:ribbon-helix-helix protein, CopG family [Deinococcus sp. 12RED42]|uniref:ribbon-helix-helix protein, CopG family n=1 Tax=Deinococcus sp. 12RED42 TaxID=2745872 RepID=UPI001E5ED9B4|nr:ribbon-helix-helix protein, CopG family [Deinococcus sp. 12RED42]MCD0164234.1 ribbon-helix-helix protein, CopG family [Deinococcus sp. 12RED42]
MAKSRFNLDLGADLDQALTRMAAEQNISKAEAVRRALTGYANLRAIITPDEELILRKKDKSGEEQRVLIL